MRFNFTIENEDEEVIMEGSTYVGEITIDGGCESIEMELFSALRALRKKLLANEVSEPAEDMSGFEGTLDALDGLSIKKGNEGI